jgi:hypothetical protein
MIGCVALSWHPPANEKPPQLSLPSLNQCGVLGIYAPKDHSAAAALRRSPAAVVAPAPAAAAAPPPTLYLRFRFQVWVLNFRF